VSLRPGAFRGRSLLAPGDCTPEEWDALLALAARGKREGLPAACTGQRLVNLFAAPSLRTRVSMELAMGELGGTAVSLTPGADAWTLETRDGAVMDGAAPEHVREAAGALGAMAHGLAVRSFPVTPDPAAELEDVVLHAYARHAGVPVTNLESPSAHPMQALADALTLREVLGTTVGQPVLLTWAPHVKRLPLAVPLSFLHAAAVCGCAIRVAAPAGWALPASRLSALRALAESRGGSLATTTDQAAAADGVRVVYAKSWAPTAPEAGDMDRRWMVDAALMARTRGAAFLHCLPVRRNVVVADAVLDSPAARVAQLAGNRLHTARAWLYAWLGTDR
jgi:N-acetylornithine carbamoyltransferase